jgi:uncharacterized linocin/CFP29 family protein
MDDRNAQVGWTDAQWNRVREEVLRAWQSVRVAGSFLPVYEGLPRATQVVPSEILNSDGTVDERSVAPLTEISLPVVLTRQQILEEDLSSALLQFRRRATQVAQIEDWHIFNGTYPYENLPDDPDVWIDPAAYRPEFAFLKDLARTDLSVAARPIGGPRMQERGLLSRNPGALGLIGGARQVDVTVKQEEEDGVGPYERLEMTIQDWPENKARLDNDGLMNAVTSAINTLERHGYTAPYACVLGRRPFEAAHKPVGASTSFPRDRIEPLIGRELMHASAIDVPPAPIPGYTPPAPEKWQKRGLVLSLAGNSVDLAMAVEAMPEFRQIDARGRYVFSVIERCALRIKDPRAIVPLQFIDAPLAAAPGPGAKRPA